MAYYSDREVVNLNVYNFYANNQQGDSIFCFILSLSYASENLSHSY